MWSVVNIYNARTLQASVFDAALVAPSSAFGSADFIHLCNSLLEFFVLTFLVTVSLLLQHRYVLAEVERQSLLFEAHLAFPREIIFVISASVQRYEEVGAAISICKR